MSLFDIPSAEAIARHFRRALLDSHRNEDPYLHWSMIDVLPEALAFNLIALPIMPLLIDDCRRGARRRQQPALLRHP